MTNTNIAKFSNLQLAIARRNRQTYNVPVLMGCDGRYWVASTNREAGRLVAAGYEQIA